MEWLRRHEYRDALHGFSDGKPDYTDVSESEKPLFAARDDSVNAVGWYLRHNRNPMIGWMPAA